MKKNIDNWSALIRGFFLYAGVMCAILGFHGDSLSLVMFVCAGFCLGIFNAMIDSPI